MRKFLTSIAHKLGLDKGPLGTEDPWGEHTKLHNG